MKPREKKLYLECLVLFLLLPIIILPVRKLIAFNVVPLLLVASSCCYGLLKKDPVFRRDILTSIIGVRHHLLSIAVIFLLVGTVLTFAAYKHIPELFLAFPREKPVLWVLVLLLYPFIAVLPQEFIFRCFFFHRYAKLFPNNTALIVINGLSFSLFHLFYGNIYAPTLSFFGGLLFAWRYSKSSSLLLVAVEHSLWGNLLYTIGFGWYFYSGSIH